MAIMKAVKGKKTSRSRAASLTASASKVGRHGKRAAAGTAKVLETEAKKLEAKAMKRGAEAASKVSKGLQAKAKQLETDAKKTSTRTRRASRRFIAARSR
jgi:hypothetical protein